ncbi:hypothetical protein D3C72_686580 [compost metagenome]
MTARQRAHHRIHPLQAHVAQDEGHDAGGQIETARQAAGGHGAAIVHLGQQLGQHLTADGVDGTGPQLFLQRLGRLQQFAARHYAAGTQRRQHGALLLGTAGQGRDAISQCRQQGDGGGANSTGGTCHQHLTTVGGYARLFQRQHAEHGGEAGGADAHGLPLIQPGRQRHQPVGLDPRLFGHAAPVSFPHAPTGQYHLVTALVAAVGRLQHCADEVDARHQRPLAHYLALAGDGQPVLVVEGAVAHRHPHLPRRQLALGQLGQRCLGLAILVVQ